MKQKAFILVILAGILWGTSGIFVHYLAPLGFSSIQMTAMRSVIAAVIITAFVLPRDRSLFRTSKIDLCIFALSAITLFGTGTCYFLSMQASAISTAVVLMYMAPVYVSVFSVMFFGERLTATKAVCVIIMLTGCALVSGISGGLALNLSGIAMGLLSGICYGAYNILTKLSMRKGTQPLQATLYVFIFTALLSLLLCDPIDLYKKAAAQPALTLPLILGIGVVTCVLPYLFYTIAMKHLDASTAASLGIVEPLTATLIGVWMFEETLDVWSGIGVLLIPLGVLLLSRCDSPKSKQSLNKAKNP